MPLVVILDPKGSGSFVIQKFIKSAERYKCVLVASNLVKNNYTDFVAAIETLIIDVRTKYPVGNKIYLAGFSGGARMALILAQIRKVNGVLVSGALTMEEEVKSINTNIFAVFGMGDFNLHEAANFFLNPNGYPANLKIELTNDNHEWPSANNLSSAVGLLLINDCPKESTCIKRKVILKEYSADCKKKLDSLMQAGDYLNACFICSNVRNLKDFPEKKYFGSVYNNLNNNPKLQNEIKLVRGSMQIEFKARDAYNKAFLQHNPEWWKQEIASINQQIDEEKDKYKIFAYKRIRAFLGIMCYSVTNNSLKAENLKDAGKVLELYRLLEPQNSDMLYFTALYLYKSGKSDSVTYYLQKALDAGYTDRKTIEENFPLKTSNQLFHSN
jgi:predicted esterase